MATRSSSSVIITPYRFTSTGLRKPLSPPKSTPLPAATTVIDITRDSDSDIPPLIPGTHTQSPVGVPGSITCGTSVPVQQPRKRSREIRSPGGSPTSAAEYLSSAASTSSFAFPLVPGGDSTASSAKTRPTKTQKVDNSSHVLDMGRREHHQHQQRQRNHHRSSSSSSRPSTCTTSTLPSSSSSFEHSHTSSTPAAPRRLKRENAIIFPNTGSSATSNATATSSSGTRTTAGSSSSRTPTPSMPSASTSTSTYEYSIPSPTWMETYMRSRFGGDSDFLFMDIDTSPCVPQADVEVDVDGDADTEMDVDLDSGSPSSTAATLSYVREQVQHRGRQRNKPTTTQTEIETPAASRSIPIQLHTMTTCLKARRKIAKERWNAERARVEKVRLEELKRLREREQEEEERLRKEAEEKEVEEKARMEKMKEALKDKKEAAKYRDEMMARAARAREERMKQEQQQLQQQEGEDSVFELRSCLPDQIQASTAPRSLRRSYALYGADEFTNALNTPPVRTRTRTRVHSTSSRPRQPSPPPLSTVPIALATRGRQPRARSSSPPERFLYDFPVVAPSPPPPPAVQFQSKRSPLLPDEFRESARHVVPDDMLPESVREWKRMSPRIPSGTVPSSYSTKAVVVCERNGVLSLEDENLKGGGSKKKLKVENKKKGISEMRRAAMVWAVESLFGRKEWLRTCMEAEKEKGMLDEQENEDELGGKVPLTKKKPTTTTKKATKPKKTRPEPEALTPLWKCRQIFRVGPRAAFLHDVVDWDMLFAGVDGGGEDREVMEREMFGADRSPQEVPTTVGGTSSATGTATTPAGALVCTDVFDATRELEMLVDDIERAQDELEIDDDEDVEMFEVAEGCGLDLGSGLGGAGEGAGEEARARDCDRDLQLELERELALAQCGEEDGMVFGMLGGERDAPGEVDDSFVVVLPSHSAVPLPSSGVSSEMQPVPIPVPSTSSSSLSTRSASTDKLASYTSKSLSLLSVSPRSPPAPPLSCSPPGKSKAAMPVMTMTAPAWVVIAKDRTGMDGGSLEDEVKSPVPVHKGAASGSSAGVKAKPEKESNCGSKMKTGGKFGLGLGLGLSFGGGGGGGRVRRAGSAWRATRSEKEDVVFGTTGSGSSAWEMVY